MFQPCILADIQAEFQAAQFEYHGLLPGRKIPFFVEYPVIRKLALEIGGDYFPVSHNGCGVIQQTILPLDMADDDVQNVESSRSEEHTSELQSLMRRSYAVFCLKKKK